VGLDTDSLPIVIQNPMSLSCLSSSYSNSLPRLVEANFPLIGLPTSLGMLCEMFIPYPLPL